MSGVMDPTTREELDALRQRAHNCWADDCDILVEPWRLLRVLDELDEANLTVAKYRAFLSPLVEQGILT